MKNIDMNKLIIITGVSGTGKSTLGKMLYNRIENSCLLSYDELSESIYDIVGFRNKDEKNSLVSLNIELYKRLIEECAKRKDEVIIVEKPFRIEWRGFFENLSEQYGYEVYTINMFAKDFETIWNRLLKRENLKQDRHPSHCLNAYSSKHKEEYLPFFEYDYDTFKEEYDELISNSINLGNVIEVEDIEKLDVEKLVEYLMN